MRGITQDTMVDMNWPSISSAVQKSAVVLIPLGVIEEHGPHLCLGTDIYTAYQYCRLVKERLEGEGRAAVLAPPFYWGVCQSTGGFIGSFRVRKETASALLYDLIASLASFGFKEIFGVNTHGDIEHSIAILEAFQKAASDFKVNARYVFGEGRLIHFGLTGKEPFVCPLKEQQVRVSETKAPDVHGGDIETAVIRRYYPDLADTARAKALPPVSLAEEDGGKWLFGGHIHALSPEGYLGSPAEYDAVDVEKNMADYSQRIFSAIKSALIS